MVIFRLTFRSNDFNQKKSLPYFSLAHFSLAKLLQDINIERAAHSTFHFINLTNHMLHLTAAPHKHLTILPFPV